MTSVSQLDLDLDVFQGPFDLLLAVLLREEISLAEVSLGDIVLAYVDRLEEAGEVDLESVTEFLVLVAALLELKSRLLLPSEDAELDLGPEEAADELLARMLEYRRYREAAQVLDQILEREGGTLYRSAPPPPELRRAAVEAAVQAYEPDRLGSALGDLLTPPPAPDVGHIRTTVSVQRRLSVVRDLLADQVDPRLRRGLRPRGPLHPGGDPVRPARAPPPRRGDLVPEGHVRPDRGDRVV